MNKLQLSFESSCLNLRKNKLLTTLLNMYAEKNSLQFLYNSQICSITFHILAKLSNSIIALSHVTYKNTLQNPQHM